MSINWGVNPITESKNVRTLEKLQNINVQKLRLSGKSGYNHHEMIRIMRSLSITTGRSDESRESLLRIFTVEDNPGSFTFMPLNKPMSYDYL